MKILWECARCGKDISTAPCGCGSEEEKRTVDPVNHPSHYNHGKIEVIEALEDWKLGFHQANAIKYIARAGRKNADTFVEDLEKAIWYLRRVIELQKKNPLRPNEMPQERANS